MIKTEKDKEEAGGVANAPYDPCYHQVCTLLKGSVWPWYPNKGKYAGIVA